jgi:hypothetical protein
MKTPIKSIAEELNDCKLAFEAYPDAKFAWTCHHSVLIEQLTEPWMNRVNYILNEKPENQQAVRLRNFRPVRVELPQKFIEGDKLRAEGDKLRAEGGKLWAEGDKLWAEGGKLWDENNKLRAEGNKLLDEGNKLWAEGNKLRAEGGKLWAEGDKLHDLDWPDNTWNGEGIF